MTELGRRSSAPIRIERWFQGPTGSGQGGWTAQRFAERLDGPVTIALRAPVPLDADLHVVAASGDDDRWELVTDGGTTVMVASPWTPTFAETTAVTVAEAADARSRFGEVVADHPVPHCFSCGLQHDSMQVHAGPLADATDDRFATDWAAPEWAGRPDGSVDDGVVWAAIDCCAAWWVGYSRAPRIALTAQYAVEILHPIDPGTTYALVGWSGDHAPEWDGRKRHAGSAAFSADGTCVARSVSFWIAVETL